MLFFFVSFHHAVFPANVTGNWIIPFHSVDTFKSIQLLIQEDHQKTEQSFLGPNNCQNLSPATSYEDSWDCQGTEDFSFLPKWQKPSRASQIHPKDFQADSVVLSFCIFSHLHQTSYRFKSSRRRKRGQARLWYSPHTVWSHPPKKPVRANPSQQDPGHPKILNRGPSHASYLIHRD